MTLVFPTPIHVMIFQYQKSRYCRKCKNSKNDFPREVKKFPSRGSKKNYVREIFNIPPYFVKIITLSGSRNSLATMNGLSPDFVNASPKLRIWESFFQNRFYYQVFFCQKELLGKITAMPRQSYLYRGDDFCSF